MGQENNLTLWRNTAQSGGFGGGSKAGFLACSKPGDPLEVKRH
jgi:hypothetical protein